MDVAQGNFGLPLIFSSTWVSGGHLFDINPDLSRRQQSLTIQRTIRLVF
jgi:hypothetical protein